MKRWKKLAWIGFGVSGWVVAGALIASLVFLGPFVTRFMLHVATFAPSLQPWHECDLPHPYGAPEVAFLQRHAHPFLSEYDYAVRFGRGRDGTRRPLPVNTGNATRINVYTYSREDGFGPVLRLQGRDSESLVRLDEQRSYRLVRYGSRTFAGELQDGWDTLSVGTMGGRNGRDTLEHVKVGGRVAEEITATPVGRGPGRYVGRIEGGPLRFIPVDAEPEVEIPMDPYLRDFSIRPGDPGAPDTESGT